MASSLYRFPDAQGLIHLLRGRKGLTNLQVQSVHGSTALNGHHAPEPSLLSTQNLFQFDHLVCDFDETITTHDTTSSFDTLACQVRPDEFHAPDLTWPQILQAYLDDLDTVAVGDLCHIDQFGKPTTEEHQQEKRRESFSLGTLHLDPRMIQGLACHTDGRTLTPEPQLPVPKIPSLQPWVHAQSRKRAVEKVSLDRVYESGNLVGLAPEQIRQYGREQVRLRSGVVEFLRAFVTESVEDEGQSEKGRRDGQQQQYQQEEKDDGEEDGDVKRKGELWILSVNWSQDLIRGAMDQVFGDEASTARHLPDSHLISSNLQFSDKDHETLQRRKKSFMPYCANHGCCSDEGVTGYAEQQKSKTKEDNNEEKENEDEVLSCPKPVQISNGKVQVHCLTGTDKLHAFQKIQRDYAANHGLALTDTKWAYLGDSSTDLGCLVEADVGIIIGSSKSLLAECERSGVEVIDLVEKS
ncbi:hypothetical protein BGZ94_000496 [Podila epigama]|nr:hypothetical protein BGZ94_000496 [Podila epigama]